jgi:hypothetical protein
VNRLLGSTVGLRVLTRARVGENPPFRGVEKTRGNNRAENQPPEQTSLPNKPAGPAPAAARLPPLVIPPPAVDRTFLFPLRDEMVFSARAAGKRRDDAGTVLLPRRSSSVGRVSMLGASGGAMCLPKRPNSSGPTAVAWRLIFFLYRGPATPEVASGGRRTASSATSSGPALPADAAFIRLPGGLRAEARSALPRMAAPVRPRSLPPAPGPLPALPMTCGCLPADPLHSCRSTLPAACRCPP